MSSVATGVVETREHAREATEETREKYEVKVMRREGENEQIKKQN